MINSLQPTANRANRTEQTPAGPTGDSEVEQLTPAPRRSSEISPQIQYCGDLLFSRAAPPPTPRIQQLPAQALPALSLVAAYSLPKSSVRVSRLETGAIQVTDDDHGCEMGDYLTTYTVASENVARLASKLGCSVADVPAKLASGQYQTAYDFIVNSGVQFSKRGSWG